MTKCEGICLTNIAAEYRKIQTKTYCSTACSS